MENLTTDDNSENVLNGIEEEEWVVIDDLDQHDRTSCHDSQKTDYVHHSDDI